MGCRSAGFVDEVVQDDGVIEGLRVTGGFRTGCWRGGLSTTPRVLRALLGDFQSPIASREGSGHEGYDKAVGRSEGFEVAVCKTRGGGQGYLEIPASKSRSYLLPASR